jgi:hypothetical protein
MCRGEYLGLRNKRMKDRNNYKRVRITRFLDFEGLHNLYSLFATLMLIKRRRNRWVGHVTCMGKRETLEASPLTHCLSGSYITTTKPFPKSLTLEMEIFSFSC